MQTSARKATDNNKALAAFIATKAEIDAMLSRLTALSENHFDVDVQTLHWGHVGDLEHYAGLLKRITDSAFREGDTPSSAQTFA